MWYELKSIVFHSPAEHTIRGIRFPLEVQFVHVAPSGARVTMSSMFVEGREHEELEKILYKLPVSSAVRDYPDDKFNAARLLPGVKGVVVSSAPYWTYMGSKTTPPCTEGEEWVIFQEFSQASGEQLQKFRRLYKTGNARPLRPLEERVVSTTRPRPHFPARADFVPLYPAPVVEHPEDVKVAQARNETVAQVEAERKEIEEHTAAIAKAAEDERAGIPNPLNVALMPDPAEIMARQREAEEAERLRNANPGLFQAIKDWAKEAASTPEPTPEAPAPTPDARPGADNAPPVGVVHPPKVDAVIPEGKTQQEAVPAPVKITAADDSIAKESSLRQALAPFAVNKAAAQPPAPVLGASSGFRAALNSVLNRLPSNPGLRTDLLLEEDIGLPDEVYKGKAGAPEGVTPNPMIPQEVNIQGLAGQSPFSMAGTAVNLAAAATVDTSLPQGAAAFPTLAAPPADIQPGLREAAASLKPTRHGNGQDGPFLARRDLSPSGGPMAEETTTMLAEPEILQDQATRPAARLEVRSKRAAGSGLAVDTAPDMNASTGMVDLVSTGTEVSSAAAAPDAIPTNPKPDRTSARKEADALKTDALGAEELKAKREKEISSFGKAANADAAATVKGGRIDMNDQANDPFRAKTNVKPPGAGETKAKAKKIGHQIAAEDGQTPETDADVMGPNYKKPANKRQSTTNYQDGETKAGTNKLVNAYFNKSNKIIGK